MARHSIPLPRTLILDYYDSCELLSRYPIGDADSGSRYQQSSHALHTNIFGRGSPGESGCHQSRPLHLVSSQLVFWKPCVLLLTIEGCIREPNLAQHRLCNPIARTGTAGQPARA
jgi:hypothetical protein